MATLGPNTRVLVGYTPTLHLGKYLVSDPRFKTGTVRYKLGPVERLFNGMTSPSWAVELDGETDLIVAHESILFPIDGDSLIGEYDETEQDTPEEETA